MHRDQQCENDRRYDTDLRSSRAASPRIDGCASTYVFRTRPPRRKVSPRMRTAIIIPARYASTRLPAKALLARRANISIQHVYEQACRVKGIETVIVATDDSRIVAAVASFGGKAVMTRADHLSGTDRVAEVARHTRR